jgi:hypothetical protein
MVRLEGVRGHPAFDFQMSQIPADRIRVRLAIRICRPGGLRDGRARASDGHARRRL